MKDTEFIVKTEDLIKVQETCNKENYITVDTEFMRDKTYYPILSLIQIATSEQIFIIDALACVSLKPLQSILVNTKLTKILHAARQDLEAFYNTFGVLPRPLFDTQIAAQFLGFQSPPGYNNLLKHFLNISVSKKVQYSDWLRRPLTARQMQYASNDVSLLHKVYPIIKQKLRDQKRLAWAEEECASWLDTAKFYPEPKELLLKFLPRTHNRHELALCFELLKWREEVAKIGNVPREHMLTDLEIIGLCRAGAHHSKVAKKLSTEQLTSLTDILANNAEESAETAIILDRQIQKSKDRLIHNELYELCKVLLKQVSIDRQISQMLITGSKELLLFANSKPSKIMRGWRYLIFGHLAEKLKLGKLHVSYRDEGIKLEYV